MTTESSHAPCLRSEVLVPGTEADGVADAMIEARVCTSYTQRLQGWKMANCDLSLVVTLNEHTRPIIAGTVWFYPDTIG